MDTTCKCGRRCDQYNLPVIGDDGQYICTECYEEFLEEKRKLFTLNFVESNKHHYPDLSLLDLEESRKEKNGSGF